MEDLHWRNVLSSILVFLCLPNLCHQQGNCPTIRQLTCTDVNECFYESTLELDRNQAVYACSCNGFIQAEPSKEKMYRLMASPHLGVGIFYWLNAFASVTDLQHFVTSNRASLYIEGEVDQLCVYYNTTKRALDRRMCKDKLPFICRKGDYMSANDLYRSWFDSRNYCLDDNGDLAYLSYGENMDLIERAANGRSMWIGSRMQTWKWRNSGAEIQYTHWEPEQPLGRSYLCVQWIAGRGWVSVLCENTRARALCYGDYRIITEPPTPPATRFPTQPAPTPPAPTRPAPTPLAPTQPAPTPPAPTYTQPATLPPIFFTNPPVRTITPLLTLPVTPPIFQPSSPPIFQPSSTPIFQPSNPPQVPATDTSTRFGPPGTQPSTIPPNVRPSLFPSSAPPTQNRPIGTPGPTPAFTQFPTEAPTKFLQTTPTIRDPNAVYPGITPKPLSNGNSFSDPSMRTKLIAGIVAGLVGFIFLLILIVAIAAGRRQRKDSDEYGQPMEESSDEGSPSTNTYSGTMNHGAALPPIVEDLEPAYSTLGRDAGTDMAESAQVSSDPSYSFYGMTSRASTSTKHDADAVYAQSNKMRSQPYSGFSY